MKLRVLGPVEARVNDQRLTLGGPRRLAVLAALVIDAGRPVPMETLIERVWGDTPPDGARDRLYVHLSRLRSVLIKGDRPPSLERLVSGYQLTIATDACDLGEFRSLAGRARTASDPVDRADLLERALALWRGAALGGLPGQWAAGLRIGLEQERLAVLVQWAQALLRLGRAGETIPRLRAEAGQFPLVEPLAVALIGALAEAGDPAGALGHFEVVRRTLAEELGADPGPELRGLHRAILRGAAVDPVGVRRAGPAQLPRDVSAFTGRADELALLDGGGTMLAISGVGGVGKTALAIRWAHRAAAGFPDGQLYVDLRGCDPEPVQPADVLTGFLRALGVPQADIPLDPAQRAAAYRTETTGLRLLIVLDNAATAEQVRPLLPGASSCTVVVTSRDRLAGLVALQGARRVDLDRLPPAEAVQLLRRLVGGRVDAEPAAAAALAERCARLPLALRVAAELAVSRPAVPLGDLVDDLPPGADLDAHPAASPAGTDPAGAGLARAAPRRDRLIHPAIPDRHWMHDLWRAYAARWPQPRTAQMTGARP